MLAESMGPRPVARSFDWAAIGSLALALLLLTSGLDTLMGAGALAEVLAGAGAAPMAALLPVVLGLAVARMAAAVALIMPEWRSGAAGCAVLLLLAEASLAALALIPDPALPLLRAVALAWPLSGDPPWRIVLLVPVALAVRWHGSRHRA